MSLRALMAVAAFALSMETNVSIQRAHAASNNTTYSEPTWWQKYQTMSKGEQQRSSAASSTTTVGSNVDISNEPTPQSETAIAIDPTNTLHLVGGSNEIVRDPMRAYYSFDGGASWAADDLPLPGPVSNNGFDFGSDPAVAFDSHGNVYYSYIVVFFSAGGLNGTEMAVARSSTGGRTWQATYFDFNSGKGVFDDKPYIAVDNNPASPYRDTVYVTYDHTSNMNGKSSAHNAVQIAVSHDGGMSFTGPQSLDGLGGGPVSDIASQPFVGPNGALYVAWQDIQNSRIGFVRSTDGGATYSAPSTVQRTNVPYEVAVPAQALRQALMYPSCGVDNSTGPYAGRLYCAYMDQRADGHTSIFLTLSDSGGIDWSAPTQVNDGPSSADRFNHWLSIDPVDGSVNVSFYDTRNDPANLKTDVYYARSTDGGTTFGQNVRVTNVQSDETAPPADLGNQYGDYEGIAAYGGVAHPIWTDGRFDATLGEEVFSARITTR